MFRSICTIFSNTAFSSTTSYYFSTRSSSTKRVLHIHRNALQIYKLSVGESKFKFVEDLVKRNLEISKINSIIQTLMQISGKSDAYRIFMIYVSSGRKMDALGNDSKVFDFMISLLVKHGRMDEAERVCTEIYLPKIWGISSFNI
jgi:pentatricopeptide repeat protein